MLRFRVELSFLWMSAAECSFSQVLLIFWGFCVCMSIPCGFPGSGIRGWWGTQKRRGGHGRSCDRCCRCQRGREEHVAASSVAGKSVLCLSVKLINKSGFSSLLTDHKPSKYWSKIGFFDVSSHFLLKKILQCCGNTYLTSKLIQSISCSRICMFISNLGEW